MKNLFLICLLFFTLTHGAAQEQPSYLTCNIGYHQLGNQLYAVSTALVTAWEHGAIPVFPMLTYKEDLNVPLNRRKIFFRLNTETPQNISWYHYLVPCGFDKQGHPYHQKVEYQPNIYLVGGYFYSSYYEPFKDQLIQTYAPSDEEEAIIQEKYGDLLKTPNLVAVHVRAFNPHTHYFVGLNYIKKAMDLFPSDYTFAVFSCRINWAKKHLFEHKPNIVFIEGNDHVRDFFLINKCKHHIISNSSYSFWAAYLKNDPDQIVIAPDINIPSVDRCAIEMYPKSWNILHVEIEDPHYDITDYPTTSIQGEEPFSPKKPRKHP
ncbi:MAG TPA: alpha-1,2-fucosyltransferase [Chlamydiales bacterium]|nr:alpha-1,2-fucosyltransferase [Chlamydiales bacterium]